MTILALLLGLALGAVLGALAFHSGVDEKIIRLSARIRAWLNYGPK